MSSESIRHTSRASSVAAAFRLCCGVSHQALIWIQASIRICVAAVLCGALATNGTWSTGQDLVVSGGQVVSNGTPATYDTITVTGNSSLGPSTYNANAPLTVTGGITLSDGGIFNANADVSTTPGIWAYSGGTVVLTSGTLSAAAQMYFSGGAILQQNGGFFSTGQFTLNDGATATYTAGDSITYLATVGTGSSLTLETDLLLPGYGYIDLSGALHRTTQRIEAGSMYIRQNSFSLGSADNISRDIFVDSGANLTLQRSLELDGRLRLEGSNALARNGNSVSAPELLLYQSATFNYDAGASVRDRITVDHSSLTLGRSLNLSQDFLLNSGTVTRTSGAETITADRLDLTDTAWTYNNNDTFSQVYVRNGATLSLVDNLIFDGSFSLQDSAVVSRSTQSISALALSLSNCSMTVRPEDSYQNYFVERSSTLTLSKSVDVYSISVSGSSAVVRASGTETIGVQVLNLYQGVEWTYGGNDSIADSVTVIDSRLVLNKSLTLADGLSVAGSGTIARGEGVTVSANYFSVGNGSSFTVRPGDILGVRATVSSGGTMVIDSGAPLPRIRNDGTVIANGSTTVGRYDGNGVLVIASSTLSIGNTDGSSVGEISGAGSLAKIGTGALTLYVANTYSGGTTLAEGVLAVSAAGALGTTGTISFGGGTLQFTSFDTTDYSARFSSDPGQAYSLDTNGESVTLGSSLTSPGGSLTKLGNGILTLSASNSFTGSARVASGTLALGHAGALAGATLDLATADSGTVAFGLPGATTYLLGGLQGSRSLDIGGNSLSIGGGGASTTYGGAITGAGGITKSGGGTLTLTGNSTFTGATTVSAGKLLVAGALGATAVAVHGGAVLGGSGTIGGAVAVLGGTLAPGSSPGKLTVASLALSGTTTTVLELVGSGSGAGTAGVDYDQVVITDTSGLSYGGALLLNLDQVSAPFAAGTIFHLFSFSGSAAGNFTSMQTTAGGVYSSLAFSQLHENANEWTSTVAPGTGGQYLVFSRSAGTVVVVPEPSSVGLLAIGAAVAAVARRSARRKSQCSPAYGVRHREARHGAGARLASSAPPMNAESFGPRRSRDVPRIFPESPSTRSTNGIPLTS